MLANNLAGDRENIKGIFKQICEIRYEDDCVFFNPESIEVSDIAEKKKYSGVRLLIDSRFDTIRQTIQIDIGFGDVITPAAVLLYYPSLLTELENPEILAYSVETVIAEKFEAMITLGKANSRMKDFFDIYILLKNNNIDMNTMKDAINATFQRRNSVKECNPAVFDVFFYKDTQRNVMWNSFLRKNRLEHHDFEEVVKTMTNKLQPLYNSLIDNR